MRLSTSMSDARCPADHAASQTSAARDDRAWVIVSSYSIRSSALSGSQTSARRLSAHPSSHTALSGFSWQEDFDPHGGKFQG